METPIAITTPLTDAVVRGLRVGQKVLLSGSVYTARDAAHQRFDAALRAGEALPFDPVGSVLYYVGPSPTPPGAVIGSAGPTTAGRVDSYTPALLAHGVRGMIGKGKRTPAVREAIVQYHAVYLVAVGGAAALIASCIRGVYPVAYEDLGTEAVRRLDVVDFPLLVANDCYGGDLYEQAVAQYREPAP